MKTLLTLVAAVVLTGCYSAADGARRAGEIWFTTLDDWNKNTQRYTDLVDLLCTEPTESNLLKMRNSHKALITAFSRTDGLDVIRSRHTYPEFIIFPDAYERVPEQVEAFVEEVRRSSIAQPRNFGDTLSSISALEYIIFANDEVITDPDRCQALSKIAETHSVQVRDYSERWTNSIQRELLEKSTESSEAYYTYVFAAIKSQLRLADRYFRAPMNSLDGEIDLTKAVSPWTESYSHIQILQPLEASRLIFFLGGPNKALQRMGEGDLGKQVLKHYDDLAGGLIGFGDYDQIVNDPAKRQAMWEMIETRERLYELIDGPVEAAFEEFYAR